MAIVLATVKCVGCGSENKENAKTCRKCGRDMAVPPAWQPDAAWHLKTLGVIYVALTVFYFGVTAVLSKLPRPYELRNIPVEMTPWLAPGGNGATTGGQREFVRPLARAAAAVGVDGIFFETHPDPDKALSDGPNSLKLADVPSFLREIRRFDSLAKEAS